jgi:hypothetical protein
MAMATTKETNKPRIGRTKGKERGVGRAPTFLIVTNLHIFAFVPTTT